MDYRSDLFPPVLALGLSLLLHSTLMGVHPLRFQEDPPDPVDTVVVQFLEEPGPEGTPATEPAAEAPAPPAIPAPAPAAPATPPAPRPTPAAKPEDPPPTAATEPPFPEPTQPVSSESPPPEPAAVPAPRPPAPPAPPAPPLEVVPAPPSLRELLPSNSDLRRYAASRELPDPTAAGVREATLSLGNADLRYRGYLDTVHASIDRSEKWKEAVLMGGGGGVVVVRMTITSLGQLEAVEVTRSSGSHLLDGAAVDAVQRARIPPFPSHWTIEKLHLHAQFNYQLVTR